ncbi:hypothetical protein HYV82_04330 [Candidatus Woesearchaeota archaeon]|nr:hypothetical protein [Candidatus Woesearchaeota archaeon]
MTIKGDAGEILLFIYDCYVNDRDSVNPEKLLETTKWEGNRIDRAIKYLKDIGAIDIITLGNVNGVQNFILKGLTPLGINIVENQPEFKRNFGFTVNLGVISFSWGASEK